MKALILNSGLGSRMGALTENAPKCMAEIAPGLTILDLQLKNLSACGVKEIIMTTGPFAEKLEQHVRAGYPQLHVTFIRNPLYAETNYIYSIALAEKHVRDALILMHGDLVFKRQILQEMLSQPKSCMAVDKKAALPEKDFKAVVWEGRVRQVGVEFFEQAVAAQPLYYLLKKDWCCWLNQILDFCAQGNRKVYAENALNTVSGQMELYPYDVSGWLCAEIDNLEDLRRVRELAAGAEEL